MVVIAKNFLSMFWGIIGLGLILLAFLIALDWIFITYGIFQKHFPEVWYQIKTMDFLEYDNYKNPSFIPGRESAK